MLIKYPNILELITKKNRLMRLFILCIGSFIAALTYNAYIVPNNIVYGGVGGLAILIYNLFGISTTLIINIITILLIILSLVLIGWKKTSYTIIGFLVYDIMITLTAPFASIVNISFDSFLFSILFYGVINGVGFGLIYKTGFNTGGSDTLVAILQHYFHLPTAKVSGIVNGIIVLLGLVNFGIIKSLYALIFLKVMNFVSDYVILGVSSHKICFIKSKKIKHVEEYLKKEFEIGYTLIDSTDGVGILKKAMIMCVVPSDRFYDMKQELLRIDENVILISNDCYTVEGGYTNKLIHI